MEILDPRELLIEEEHVSSCTDPDFLRLISVAEEDISSWEKACSGDNITVYKKAMADSPIVLLKAYATIENISINTCYEVMSNTEVRRKWDTVLNDF